MQRQNTTTTVAGVEGYAIGDEVFGVAPGCFGAAAIAPAQLLVPKPPGISFVEAATTPTTYVTVYSAFGGLTALAHGTKVHAGHWHTSDACSPLLAH